jgi:hypothetical protein
LELGYRLLVVLAELFVGDGLDQLEQQDAVLKVRRDVLDLQVDLGQLQVDPGREGLDLHALSCRNILMHLVCQLTACSPKPVAAGVPRLLLHVLAGRRVEHGASRRRAGLAHGAVRR